MKRFIAIILFCIVTLSAFAEPRNALLIANGEYQKFSKLANPVSEARALAKSLQELGFEVNLVENASFETMNIEIKKFRDKLKTDKGIGFFHYGGHAVQVQGENYLIPVNADIPNEDYVPSRTVNVSEVMNSMLADTNIIILDSCRDNPFVGSGRSASRGLQSVKFKPKNSVIVYSAEAGKAATDGVFTPILTQKIKENQDLLYVLRDVRNEVYNRTNGEQTPGEYNQLMTAVNLCVGIPSRLAAVEAENERINKELELLRAKQNSANSKEKQEAEIELRRVEAEAKRKQLELQQVREAEARRAAEEKRLAEEQAKRNENQKKQDEQFAKMQADNAAKLREIERLKNDQAGLEEMVATANEIKKTIAKITSDFNTAMVKAIADTKSFYQKKRDEIKIGKWETDDEFAVRKKNETAKLNKSEDADITKIKSDYQKEIDGNTVSLKRQLQAILDKPIVVSGNRIKVVFREYERNEQRFPFSVSDSQNNQTKYELSIDVRSKDATERNRKCQEVDTNIQSGGYVGYIEYGVIYDKSADKYIADMCEAGLKKLSDNTTVVSLGINDIKRIAAEKYQKELTEKMEKSGFVFVEGIAACSSLWVCDHEVT
ncbi:MAG: caspase family protein, partial [Spirochaetales bacterium]|nr:caspase family protein [Spirochaetales bacterium]